jgi:hypothetical protein
VHDRQSPLSEKTWQDVEASVTEVISQLENKYGDRIIMYWPALGDVGEWYYGIWNGSLVPGFGPCTVAGFQSWASNTYGSVAAMNTAWGTSYADFSEISVPTWEERNSASSGDFFDPAVDRYVIDFFDFFNGTMNYGAKRIAAHVKNITNGKKLVGMFWQYLHPLGKTTLNKAGLNHSGHLKLMDLLDCPDIDVLSTPCYHDVEHWKMPFHGTVDAIQQHGKLYWQEDDLGTYLSLRTIRAADIDETLKTYAYDFQEWSERQCGFFFFDIPVANETNSILNDPDIWDYVAERLSYWEDHCMSTNGAQFAPEIAVIRNEKTSRYMVSRNPIIPAVYSSDKTNSLTQMIQHIVQVRDTPVGWYMLDDFIDGKIPDSVKMFIFADTFTVDRFDAFAVLNELDSRPGSMAVWFYAPGYMDTTPLSGAAFLSDWYVNRLTGGIRPGCFASPVRDRVQPVSHALTDGVPSFGTDATNFNSQFYIRSGLANVETLCVYADDTNKIAAAILPLGMGTRSNCWDSVYICTPTIAPELLANLVDILDLRRVDGFNSFGDLHTTNHTLKSQWTVYNGNWGVDCGELYQTNSSTSYRIALQDYQASNLSVEVDIKIASGSWSGIQIRKTAQADNYFTSGYLIYMMPSGVVKLYKPGGAFASAATGLNPALDFVRLKVEAVGSSIKVYANGNLVINATDSTYIGGYVGLITGWSGDTKFDRFRTNKL